MTTVFPPQFRDFPRTDFLWAVGSKLPSGAAIIDGGFADFASVVGGETVTIDANGGGPTVVTLQAGDVTAAAVAARINGTGSFGTAGPGGTPMASDVDGGERVRLTASTSVAVTAHSGRDAFERTGLPIVTRDTAAAASASFSVPLAVEFDRVDAISDNAMDVPPGANVVGVVVEVESGDPTDGGNARIQYALGWEMEDGRGAPPFTVILGTVLETAYDEADAQFDPENPGATIKEAFYNRSSRQVLNAPGIRISNAFTVQIPPGAVKLRIFAGSVIPPVNPGGEDIVGVPAIPPVLRVSAWPGAR